MFNQHMPRVDQDAHQRRTLSDDHGNWLPLNWGCGQKRHSNTAGNQDVAGCDDFGNKIRVVQ